MIRPVDFNGMLQRTEDVGQVKHQADAKPVVDQQNIQIQMEKRGDEIAHQVIESKESENTKNDADAREEGKNKYTASRKTGKKKGGEAEVPGPGRVIMKKANSSFDMKI